MKFNITNSMSTTKISKIIRYNLKDKVENNDLEVDESAVVYTSAIMTYIVKNMIDLSVQYNENIITPVSFQKAVKNNNDLHELLLQCISHYNKHPH